MNDYSICSVSFTTDLFHLIKIRNPGENFPSARDIDKVPSAGGQGSKLYTSTKI
jgi:hypothetical protein